MADISKLSRLVGGVQRHLDLTANTLVLQNVKLNLGTAFVVTFSGTPTANRTITMPDTDVDLGKIATAIQKDGSIAFTAAQSMGGFKLTNVADPTVNQDAATKFYVDSAVGSATSFFDTTFRISNTSDNTKKIAFQAAGISTGTVRTITMPNANVDLGNLTDSNIAAGAGIAYTKLALTGSIVNADINAAAAIAYSKLAILSANKVLVSDGSGVVSASALTATDLILRTGAVAFTANQSHGGFKITNLADPTSAQDAATKFYVDSVAQGLRPKQAVRVGTTANISLSSAPASIDGVTLSANDRVLVKNQTSAPANGIYVFNGAASAMTRALDMDSLSPIDEINGAYTFIQEGSQAGQGWVEQGTVVTLGTDNMNWVYFNSAAGITGGDMILLTGQNISVDLATISGLESSNPGNAAGQLRVKLEASNPSLQIDGSNQLGVKLDPAGAIVKGSAGTAAAVDGSTIEISSNALRVKDAGITLAKLASNSVDENKIVSTAFNAAGAVTGGSGAKIAVQVDSSTIEINTNALRVKDAGITAAKLNSNVADQATITGGAGSALAVAYAPAIKEVLVAGESFAANTLWAVRYAKAADAGFVAGRMYKADIDATSVDNFYVVGLAISGSSVSAAGNLTVVKNGVITATAHGFTVGAPLFLSSSGAITATAPSAANSASVRVGMVKDANTIDVQIQVMGVA